MHSDHVSILWRPSKIVHEEVISEEEYNPELDENTVEPVDNENLNTIPDVESEYRQTEYKWPTDADKLPTDQKLEDLKALIVEKLPEIFTHDKLNE
jgi:hypothetical protein